MTKLDEAARAVLRCANGVVLGPMEKQTQEATATAIARAVLNTIRTPDVGMIGAGYASGFWTHGDADPLLCWQAMIDSLLEGR